MTRPFRLSLLGAESSGKTTLCAQIANTLSERGLVARVVWEYLREWCEREQRTPRPHEQLAIAEEQARRVEAAAAEPGVDVVVSDTAPLMVAVYSDMLFGDTSLYDMALAHQRSLDLTLVMGLDIPWVADGLQRDGPHVRPPIDAKVREALARGDVPYQTVYGQGPTRLENALRALDARIAPERVGDSHGAAARHARWVWMCDKCSDPECEHRLFSQARAR